MIPLCVDLDGTLIKTNSLLESSLLLLKKNPGYLFLCMYWLLFGIANLKYEIARRTNLNPATLPYTTEFLTYLQDEYKKGRELILATAANKKIAKVVANYLGIFTHVIASDKTSNLKGNAKRRKLCEVVGQNKYDYAGNSKSDLKIWSTARKAILVNTKKSLYKQAKNLADIERVFPKEHNKIKYILKAIRVHQYIKNILIFIPLIASHLYFNVSSIMSAIIAFIAFCLMSSSVYLINDLLDLESDRHHHSKHKRPFAAGNLSIESGFGLTILFISCSIALAHTLNTMFLLILILYFILTTTYSFYLKNKLLVDVFLLASLYTIRIVAGTAVINTYYSEWLIIFSLFFFLSLAFVKRFSELHALKKINKQQIIGRGYHIEDINQISMLGITSGYIASLVFAFYINSNKVKTLYHHPQWLWLVCIILLYWISRVWLLANRGLITDDPVLFALNDKISILSGITIFCIMLLACL